VFFIRSTEQIFSLPYNPALLERAKKLRKARNLTEVLLWQKLHRGKFKRLDFDRQTIIGNFIVDFYCPNCRVVIEVDGSSHNEKAEQDQERDNFLRGLGLTVIRISAYDILHRLDEVMIMLHNHPALQN